MKIHTINTPNATDAQIDKESAIHYSILIDLAWRPGQVKLHNIMILSTTDAQMDKEYFFSYRIEGFLLI